MKTGLMKAKLVALAHLVLLLTACSHLASHPDWVQAPSAQELEAVLSGAALFGEAVEARELPDYNLMALSPRMEQVADEVAHQHDDPYLQAEALHHALMSSRVAGGEGLRYSALETAPAAEAFDARQVNCLSYSLMFVAMARHMGLDAQLNEVDVPPSWSQRDNDSFLFFRHVNSKVKLPGGDELVVDLELEQYSPVYDQTMISDTLAAAQFYNNRGMELLAEGKTRAGFVHLRKALELDAGQSYIWSNLGTVYNRRGHYHEAEMAYLQGLSLHPRDLTIMSNLSTLYSSLGETDKSQYFYRLVREHRSNNPYYLYAQAQAKLAEGDVRRAEALLNDAIRRQSKEPRFYGLAAEIYERRKQPEKAERMRREELRWSREVYL